MVIGFRGYAVVDSQLFDIGCQLDNHVELTGADSNIMQMEDAKPEKRIFGIRQPQNMESTRGLLRPRKLERKVGETSMLFEERMKGTTAEEKMTRLESWSGSIAHVL